jgi:hypothetical protein
MKRSGTFTRIAVGLGLITLGLSTQAATLINDFTVPFDYVANGIVGDTNWDGMYLRFGDIPGGDVGGNPAGDTAYANTTTYPGYLNLRSSGGDWADAGDDGVLIWKLVAGDFDVSVQSSPFNLNGGTTFDNGNYHMAGLMARAYNPDNSGSPYSTTVTNKAENYVMLLRFQEFGINEVNEATNGVRAEHVFGDSDADTGTARYFRMVRSSLTNFTFFWKTNQGDAWAQIRSDLPGGVLVRSDLTGPLQVGIAQSPFSDGTHDAVFTDFELSGAGVTFPTMPPAPSALVTTATNTAGTLTFSWTLGKAGDSSLVVLSKRPIQYNPVQGITYTANAAFGTAGTLLGGAGEYVVYSGTGSSVTVTNLGANIVTYYAAVYEYTPAPSPVYNTAAPATNAFVGPGIVTGAALSIPTNSLPLNGAVVARLIARYSTGDTDDQSANTTWVSSDSTIASVNAAGVVSALTNGTATITGSFVNFSPTTNVTVRAPLFTDSFNVSQDYDAHGLQGTRYDQLFLNAGDVPGGNPLGTTAGDVEGKTTVFNANISSNNTLYVTSSGGTWEDTGNDGPFLAKVIPGDFQASIHITQMDQLNFNCAGLMARLFGTGGAAAGAGETHVNLWKVQNGTPQVRLTVDDALTTTLPGLAAADRWLLMTRVNSTNFYFFESSDPATAGWSLIAGSPLIIAEAAANAAMEVGVAQQMQNAAAGMDVFDSLMIDGPGLSFPTPPTPASGMTAVLNSDLTMMFTWNAGTTANPVRSFLVMRQGGPITAQFYPAMAGAVGGTGNPVNFPSGYNLGDGNYVIYGSPFGGTATNFSVTVTGLTPGEEYYAAVYTFTGSGSTKQINPVLPATGATANLVDGVLESLTVTPPPTVPLGGLVIPQVIGHYTGGGVKNVSAFADFTSANTNIAAIGTGSGAISGMGLGSTTVQVVYKGFTNTVAITVRQPSFADEFNANHDYVANGVAGSSWDGIYLNQGDIPESGYAGTGSTTAAVASGGVLSVTNQIGGWAGAQNDGFFLFKYVPGDFQAAVHCRDFQIAIYQEVGLLARGYSYGTNGTDRGAPFGRGLATPTSAEYWMGFTKFDEYNIGTYARRNLNNTEEQFTQPPTAPPPAGNFAPSPDNWLLIIRQGTNFTFFQRDTNAEPWRLTPNSVTLGAPVFAGMPMQVGIQQTPYTATGLYGVYEHFMLDVTTGPTLAITQAGGNVTISWPLMPGNLQYTLGVNPASWLPLTGVTPVLTNGRWVVTVPITAAPRYFRLVQ